MKMIVRVEVAEEHRAEYFAGDSASCPPLPRIGEFVILEDFSGYVVGVTHNLRYSREGPVLYIEISTTDSPSSLPSRPL